MPDGYYHVINKTEEFGPGPDIVVLPPENPFWSPLPDGHELTYDGGGLPNGTAPIAPPSTGTPDAIRIELAAVGITADRIARALYLSHRGDSTLLNALDATIDTIAANQGVNYADVSGVI